MLRRSGNRFLPLTIAMGYGDEITSGCVGSQHDECARRVEQRRGWWDSNRKSTT